MAAREVLTLNESTPEIRAPITGDTYSMPRSLAIAGETITAAANALSIAQTWNNAGVTFTGLFLNITSTASAAASLLMDLQIGGASAFSVRKNGLVTIGSGSQGIIDPNAAFNGDMSFGSTGGSRSLFLDQNNQKIQQISTGLFTWANSTTITNAADTGLSRISAALVGIGNGTAADFSGGIKLTNLTVNRAATFLSTSIALTNGAGAGAGTLTTAPAAGNPTKWIGIDDNGTTRYIPAW